jgi:hypothetical protein
MGADNLPFTGEEACFRNPVRSKQHPTGYVMASIRPIHTKVAGRHIKVILVVLDGMVQSGQERPEQVETFKMLAIVMGEDERYDEAVDICKKALSLGLEDGTNTGFEGRIARLEKKRNAGSG